MAIQVTDPVADPVAEPAAQADRTKKLEARDEKADDQLETVYVGMLVAVGLALLSLFRPNRPKRTA